MLTLENVVVHYGNIRALHGISLEVRDGEVVTMIGANGAGKSTTLKTISGLLKHSAGRITLNGTPLGGKSAEQIVKLGICHVPEGRRIFPGLTVYENLEVATASWRQRSQSIQAELDRVFAIFPRLRERLRQLGWSLSGGEQQMLAIGRALMARPKLLLLDEPSLGLAPLLVQEVFETIREINQQGVTILLVEQNAFLALKTANRGYVIENGQIAVEGPAAELAKDARVKAAYLGG